MYGISPFILLVIPFLIQIIWGSKAIKKKIKLNFGYISLISIILQIPLSILSLAIASYNFNESLDGREYKCGMGFLGIIAFAFLFFMLLIITIIVQYFIKRYYDKK